MRLRILFLVAVLLTLPLPAFALTPEVRDDAGFFKRETLTKADEIIKDIKKDKKKDLLIETFRSPPDAKEEEAKSTDHKEKDRFFSEWALERARANKVNGIYVLICREPPYIKVLVGDKTRKIFTDDERDHLAKILVDRFKAKEYDEGLLEGVRYVEKTLKDANGQDHDSIYHPSGGGHHGDAGAGLPPVGGGGDKGGSILGGWLCPGLAGLLCVGLVAVVGVFVLTRLFRGGASAGPGGGSGPGGYGGGYAPGYGGGYAPSSGGGFGGMLGSFAASMFGSAAGAWVYDSFFGGHRGEATTLPPSTPASTYDPGMESSTPSAPDTDYTAGGGGDFGGGSDDAGGGGGGDFGGGDTGGGGGDFGGGDAGGGEAGASGGGDF